MRKVYRKLSLLVIFSLVVTLFVPVPQKAYAASELYLGYEFTYYGERVVDQGNSERLKYRITDLNFCVGDSVDLSFIGAENWDSLHDCEQYWSSSNTYVATVNGDGVVTAKGLGSATITFRYKTTPKLIGNIYEGTASIKVYVGDEKNGWNVHLGMNADNLISQKSLNVGEKIHLGYWGITDWNDALYYNVRWDSENSKIATVDEDGNVTAKGVGKTRIRAQIYNIVSQALITPWVDIEVKQPVKNGAWENKCYNLYGDDYLKIFSDSRYFLNPTMNIVKLNMDTMAIFNEKMKKANGTAFFAMFDAIQISVDKLMGVDKRDRVKLEAAKKFISLFYKNGETSSFLYDLVDDLETIDFTASSAEEIYNTVQFHNLYSKNVLTVETIRDINESSKKRYEGLVKTVQYGAILGKCVNTTFILYMADNELLEMLQKVVDNNSELYKHIDMIKKEKEKDTVEYFFTEVCSESVRKVVADAITDCFDKRIPFFTAVQLSAEAMRRISNTATIDELTEATYMLSYAVSLYEAANNIRDEIANNYYFYSEKELQEKIKLFEIVYSSYLITLKGFMESTQKMGNDAEKAAITRYLGELTNNYTYEKYIRYCIDEMKSGKITSETPSITLNAPSNLKAVAGNGTITVSWSAVSGAQNYCIYLKHSDGEFELVKNNISSTSCTLSNLVNGTRVGIAVRAFNSEKWSNLSSTIWVTPSSTNYPSGTTGVTTANLRVRQCPTTSSVQIGLIENGTQIRISGATVMTSDGNVWCYADEYGGYVSLNFLTSITKPNNNLYASTPTGVSVTNNNGNITITWTSVSNARYYALYIKDTSGNTMLVHNRIATNSFSVNVRPDGQKLGFVVKAYASGIWGGYSSTAWVKVSPAVRPPASINVIPSSTSAIVTWEAVPGAQVYALFMKKTDGTVVLIHNRVTTNSYNVTGLSSGTDVGFVVKAYMNRTWSGWSKVAWTKTSGETSGKVYGYLDISSAGWSGYNVGLDYEMNADKAYTIRQGAALEILGEKVNSKGNKIYRCYSSDLKMECYVSAKYVVIN